MVDVVIVCVVARDALQRIKWEAVPAMIVHALHRREEEQEHRLARRQTRQGLRETRPDGLEHEPLERVVVRRAKRVRHVKPVVHRVEMLVEPAVRVHRAVEEVLPGVHEEPAPMRAEAS